MRINRWVVVLGLLLAACGPASGGGHLPFSTIEQKNDAAYIGQQQYNALDPGVLVFFDRQAALDGGVWFSEQARRKLDQVDWRTQIVVAVFQGWQPAGGYGIAIEQVQLRGGTLRLLAEVQTPGASESEAVTSPYHLIALSRPLAPEAELVFELLVDGQVVTRYPPPGGE